MHLFSHLIRDSINFPFCYTSTTMSKRCRKRFFQESIFHNCCIDTKCFFQVPNITYILANNAQAMTKGFMGNFVNFSLPLRFFTYSIPFFLFRIRFLKCRTWIFFSIIFLTIRGFLSMIKHDISFDAFISRFLTGFLIQLRLLFYLQRSHFLCKIVLQAVI